MYFIPAFRLEKITESLDSLEDVINEYEEAFSVQKPPTACVNKTVIEDDLYDDAVSLDTAKLGQGSGVNQPRSPVSADHGDETWYDDAISCRKECQSEGHSPRSPVEKQGGSPRSRTPPMVIEEGDYDVAMYDDAFSPTTEPGKYLFVFFVCSQVTR